MNIVRKYVYSIHNLHLRLRYHRKLSPKSLAQLCTEAGITSAHWYSIEKGRVGTLPEETLNSIQEALGKDLSLPVPEEPKITVEDVSNPNPSVSCTEPLQSQVPTCYPVEVVDQPHSYTGNYVAYHLNHFFFSE